MKFKNILKMFLLSIIKKRKKNNKLIESIVRLAETKEVAKKNTELSLQDKRKKLKELYAKVLTGTPFEADIPTFQELIDQVPEDYIEYELGIDLDKALGMVKELMFGQGDLTQNELKNVMNIVAGIGIPAIDKHAAQKVKMESPTFGSYHMNQNVNELLNSLEARRNPKDKLPAPEVKDVVPTTKSIVPITKEIVPVINERLKKIFGNLNISGNSEFWKIASKLKTGKGINTDRLVKSFADIMANSDTFEEAKKKAKEAYPSLDFKKGEDFFYTFWQEAQKKKEEEVEK